MAWLRFILCLQLLGFGHRGVIDLAQGEVNPEAILDDPHGYVGLLRKELERINPLQEPEAWARRTLRYIQAWDNDGIDDAEISTVMETLAHIGQMNTKLQKEDITLEVERLSINIGSYSKEGALVSRQYEALLANPKIDRWPGIKARVMSDYAIHLSSIGEEPLAIQYNEKTLLYMEEHKIDNLPLLVDTKVQLMIFVDMQGLSTKVRDLQKEILGYCEKYKWRYFCFNQFYNYATNALNEEKQESLERALPYLAKAEKLAAALDGPYEMGLASYARLKVYKIQNKPFEAIAEGHKAIEFFKEINQNDFIVFTYERMAQIEFQQERFDVALSFAEQALDHLASKDYQSSRQSLYELLYRIYKAKRKEAKALQYHELFHELAIKQFDQREKAKYEQAAARLGLRVEEERNKVLGIQLEDQKRLIASLVAGTFLSLMALALGLSNLRKNRLITQAEQKLRGMMMQIRLGIVILDPDLRVQGAYSSFLHELFAKNESFRGVQFLSFLRESLAEADVLSSLEGKLRRSFWQPLKKWEELEAELPTQFTLVHKTGERRLLLTWQALVDSQQKVHQLLLILRDITEESRLREEVELQKEKLVALGTLTATVAHDIASPSQVIASSKNLIQDKIESLRNIFEPLLAHEGSKDAQDLWRLIEGELKNFLLVTQNIDVAIKRIIQIQSAIRNQTREDLSLEKFCLSDLLEESLTLTHSSTRALRIQILCPKDLQISAYRSQLGQVLTNLINNAGDAVEESPKERANKPYDIIIRGAEESGVLRIQVEDAGQGVQPSLQKKIFQPFFTAKGLGKGTGLGLSICTKIVQQHKGEISLKTSETLGGACFEIRLPIEQDQRGGERWPLSS